jgi:hypothetical protein
VQGIGTRVQVETKDKKDSPILQWREELSFVENVHRVQKNDTNVHSGSWHVKDEIKTMNNKLIYIPTPLISS